MSLPPGTGRHIPHQLLSTIIDRLNTQVCVIDDRGEIVVANHAWRDFFTRQGGDAEAVKRGQCDLEAFNHLLESGSNEELRCFYSAAREVINHSQAEITSEYSCRFNDRWYRFIGTITPVQIEGVTYGIICCEDSTERTEAELKQQQLSDEQKKLEQELQKSHDLLASLSHRIPEMIYQFRLFPDGNCCFPYVSSAIKRIYGLTPEQVSTDATPLLELIHPQDFAEVMESIQDSAGTLESWDKQFRVVLSSGEIRWNLGSARPQGLEDGSVLWHGIFSDITLQKERELELRKLLRAVQQSPVTILITDTEGLIEFVNPKFTELTGYSADEAIGQNPRILNAGQTPPEIFTDLWDTISSGNIWCGEVLNKTKNGTLFWEIATISPLFDDNGLITNYLAVKEDVTEKRRVLNQLIEAKNAAEMATQAKSSFLATMSHEIRTPMNGVIGMANMLFETHLSPEQREYTDIIRKSAENLLAIINEILDFSKIEAGKLELEQLDFDLRHTIEDTTELLAFRAADKGIELFSGIAPNVPLFLTGDSGRLRQIIINLVGNAIKFTHQGEIVVTASLTMDHGDNATILFEVSDTGIGIPPDRLDAVFSAYSQAESGTARKYGGTGLGLPICKQLVELMGGTIGVTSEMGKGSTFWFTAQLNKQTGPLPLTPAANPDAAFIGFTTLIVTGSATNYSLLSTQLHQWGCLSTAAPDGETALALLRSEVKPTQLVLIDEKLSGMDGRELGQQIKRDPQLAALPLVMLIAADNRGDAGALSQLGFQRYLAKPVRRDQLHDCIALLTGTAQDKVLPTGQKPPELSHGENDKTGVRILLAEDNLINQKVALSMLGKMGYQADVASDGREAVRALERTNYDVVFMDCMMPEMDGFEATATIRDLTSAVRNHDVPIIAMTANAMADDRQACLAAGMNDYLAKPVRKEELARVMEEWLRKDTGKESPVSEPSNNSSETLFLFDETELLSIFDDDRDFAESILTDALLELPEDLKTLNELAAGDDAPAISIHAHTIKGLAANICTPSLREICYEIETAALDNNLVTVRNLLPELTRITALTIEAVNKNLAACRTEKK